MLVWVKVIFVSGAVLYQFTYSSVSDIYKLKPAGLIGTDLFTMKVGYSTTYRAAVPQDGPELPTRIETLNRPASLILQLISKST